MAKGDKVTGIYYMTRSDGVKLFRFAVPNIKNEKTGEFWSPKFKIKQDQTGIEYDEASDVENAPYTYTETDKPIDVPEDDPGDGLTVADTLKILNEFGVDTDD